MQRKCRLQKSPFNGITLSSANQSLNRYTVLLSFCPSALPSSLWGLFVGGGGSHALIFGLLWAVVRHREFVTSGAVWFKFSIQGNMTAAVWFPGDPSDSAFVTFLLHNLPCEFISKYETSVSLASWPGTPGAGIRYKHFGLWCCVAMVPKRLNVSWG